MDFLPDKFELAMTFRSRLRIRHGTDRRTDRQRPSMHYASTLLHSNLSLGYFAPRSTQPSIPPGSVNEYQLRLGRQRQVWLIPIADERVGMQVKLWNPLRTRAIPERFCGGDSLRRGAISSVCTFTLPLPLLGCDIKAANKVDSTSAFESCISY